MNILVDAHVFDDKHQGSRTYLKGLYVALILQKPTWNFYLAAQNITNLQNEFGEHKNLEFLELKKSNKFYRLLIELPSLIKKYNINYTHFQYTIPPFKRGKYIVTIHDILFEQEEFKSYFPLKGRMINHVLHKYAAHKADILLTVSEFSKRKLEEIYNIPLGKILVTPNAINTEFYDPEISPRLVKEKYILYVSRIEPRKNHLQLLKAYLKMECYKDYKLIFIGKKDLSYPELDTYIKKHSDLFEDHLIFLENVPTDQLVNYYRYCSLFVFPSLAEGFGIPPLEAMALKSKLLCSNATAMSDFNLPESISFDPNNVEELKQKMEYQLANEQKSSDAYDEILSKYSWSKIAKDFSGMIDQHHRTN